MYIRVLYTVQWLSLCCTQSLNCQKHGPIAAIITATNTCNIETIFLSCYATTDQIILQCSTRVKSVNCSYKELRNDDAIYG